MRIPNAHTYNRKLHSKRNKSSGSVIDFDRRSYVESKVKEIIDLSKGFVPLGLIGEA